MTEAKGVGGRRRLAAVAILLKRRKLFLVSLSLGVLVLGVLQLLLSQGTVRTQLSEPRRRETPPLVDVGAKEDSQSARQLRLQTFCGSTPRGRSLPIYTDTPHRLAYCSTPKIGCTFWLNVFRFWVNNTGSVNVTTPYDISRVHTHYGGYDRMNLSYSSHVNNTSLRDGPLRFMFTREPYHRLWSAYIDKMLLPDFWVLNDAKNIIRRRFPNASRTSIPEGVLRCPRNITFREFIQLLVTSDPKSYNNHWLPVHQLCDPCLFFPHVLGKMETFDLDSRTILDHANESWILDSMKGRDKIVHEMNMLTDYNFWALSRYSQDCINASGLSQRLWQAFQFNGYLPDIPVPKAVLEKEITADEFKQVVLQAYEASKTTSADVRERRNTAFQWAYSTVDLADKQKLADIYRFDFLLFDYDPLPKDVFGTR